MRYDCVQLKQVIKHDNCSFEFARIAWIVSAESNGPMCIALPLLTLDTNQGTSSERSREAIGALYTSMKLVTAETYLVHFNVSDIARIVQVQFVLSKNCTIGIINRFYHSKIIYSTSHASQSHTMYDRCD